MLMNPPRPRRSAISSLLQIGGLVEEDEPLSQAPPMVPQGVPPQGPRKPYSFEQPFVPPPMNPLMAEIAETPVAQPRGLMNRNVVPDEIKSLLTPSQQEAVKPGLWTSIGNFIASGETPRQRMANRAKEILDAQDMGSARQRQAAMQKEIAELGSPATLDSDSLKQWYRAALGIRMRHQDPTVNSVLSGGALSALNPDDPYKLGAGEVMFDPRTNKPIASGGARPVTPDEPQVVGGIKTPTGPVKRGVYRDGRIAWEMPEAVDPAKASARDDVNFQRMATRATPLASSFQRETERHQVVAESLTTINGLRDPALAGDGAAQHMLVFALMKLADPGSAVRQDERADTKNAANVPERLRAAYNSLLGGGGKLSPATVQDFLSTVNSTRDARIKDFDALKGQFDRRAKILKVDPELVTSDYFENVRGGVKPTGKASSGTTDVARALDALGDNATNEQIKAWITANPRKP